MVTCCYVYLLLPVHYLHHAQLIVISSFSTVHCYVVFPPQLNRIQTRRSRGDSRILMCPEVYHTVPTKLKAASAFSSTWLARSCNLEWLKDCCLTLGRFGFTLEMVVESVHGIGIDPKVRFNSSP